MPHKANTTLIQEVLLEIIQAVGQIKYGSIETTVHEGRATQLERREKVRFNQDASFHRTISKTTTIS